MGYPYPNFCLCAFLGPYFGHFKSVEGNNEDNDLDMGLRGRARVQGFGSGFRVALRIAPQQDSVNNGTRPTDMEFQCASPGVARANPTLSSTSLLLARETQQCYHTVPHTLQCVFRRG